MMPSAMLGGEIKRSALEIGFDLVGIAPVDISNDLAFARQWVERGFAGKMEYLANPKRNDLRLVFPSVKSVICVGLLYNTDHPYSTKVCSPEGSRQEAAGTGRRAETNEQTVREDGGPRAWISRYAWGEDYHDIVRAKLEKLRGAIETLAPGTETRVYVDTGPVVERAFARFSGVGWMGKNTCLINEGKGSWFFLGIILTNLKLTPDLPAPDRCGSCTACLEACPTHALVEPYVMDASRCISYLTIELKGSIPKEHRAAMGANVFGCDICQDVCPWNSKGRSPASEVRSREASFQPMRVSLQRSFGEDETPDMTLPGDDWQENADGTQFSLFNPPLDALASLTEEEFHLLFTYSPIKRAKYQGWLRNLCVAMGNSGDPQFIPRLEEFCHHPDAVIREHAAWALKRLRG